MTRASILLQILVIADTRLNKAVCYTLTDSTLTMRLAFGPTVDRQTPRASTGERETPENARKPRSGSHQLGVVTGMAQTPSTNESSVPLHFGRKVRSRFCKRCSDTASRMRVASAMTHSTGCSSTRLAEIAGYRVPRCTASRRQYEKLLLLDPLRLRPDVGYAIGVENWALATPAWRSPTSTVSCLNIRRGSSATSLRQGPPEEYLDWAAPRIDELVREAGVEPQEIIGVGISQVGPINVSTGHPHPAGLVNKSWRDVNVGDQLARRLVKERSDWESVPTGTSDNDTNLSALAEHTFGNAQGVEHLVYVNWSNHVGFGLILGGAQYRGSRGYAGELGHLLIEDDRSLKERANGKPCLRCGRWGAWRRGSALPGSRRSSARRRTTCPWPPTTSSIARASVPATKSRSARGRGPPAARRVGRPHRERPGPSGPDPRRVGRRADPRRHSPAERFPKGGRRSGALDFATRSRSASQS